MNSKGLTITVALQRFVSAFRLNTLHITVENIAHHMEQNKNENVDDFMLSEKTKEVGQLERAHAISELIDVSKMYIRRTVLISNIHKKVIR